MRDPDAAKLAQLVFRVVEQSSAHAAMIVVGERLGLYRALAGAGGLTPGQLAQATGTGEHYVRKWLDAQVGDGLVGRDPAGSRYRLSPEQVVALTDEDSPAYLPGFFRFALRARSAARRASSDCP